MESETFHTRQTTPTPSETMSGESKKENLSPVSLTAISIESLSSASSTSFEDQIMTALTSQSESTPRGGQTDSMNLNFESQPSTSAGGISLNNTTPDNRQRSAQLNAPSTTHHVDDYPNYQPRIVPAEQASTSSEPGKTRPLTTSTLRNHLSAESMSSCRQSTGLSAQVVPRGPGEILGDVPGANIMPPTSPFGKHKIPTSAGCKAGFNEGTSLKEYQDNENKTPPGSEDMMDDITKDMLRLKTFLGNIDHIDISVFPVRRRPRNRRVRVETAGIGDGQAPSGPDHADGGFGALDQFLILPWQMLMQQIYETQNGLFPPQTVTPPTPPFNAERRDLESPTPSTSDDEYAHLPDHGRTQRPDNNRTGYNGRTQRPELCPMAQRWDYMSRLAEEDQRNFDEARQVAMIMDQRYPRSRAIYRASLESIEEEYGAGRPRRRRFAVRFLKTVSAPFRKIGKLCKSCCC